MKLPDMRTALATALAQAESDWHTNVGEHARQSGSRLDQMFQLSGYSRFGVPKGVTEKVPDWCGMAVVSWLIAGGLNTGFNTSFLHTFNVEAFFTYGAKKNVNPARFDRFAVVDGVHERIDLWHARERCPRRWRAREEVNIAVEAKDADIFRPGDVVLLDWSGVNDADHITMVRHWEPASQLLTLIEGNRSGRGPDGKARKDSVVVVGYDLSTARARRQVYGVGRLSPLDFATVEVR